MTPAEIKLLINDYDGDLVYMFERLRKLEDVAIAAKECVGRQSLGDANIDSLEEALKALDEV